MPIINYQVALSTDGGVGLTTQAFCQHADVWITATTSIVVGGTTGITSTGGGIAYTTASIMPLLFTLWPGDRLYSGPISSSGTANVMIRVATT